LFKKLFLTAMFTKKEQCLQSVKFLKSIFCVPCEKLGVSGRKKQALVNQPN